jgi:cytosine/adenosine deaminase-related metal-dependent hydrolase
VGLGCDVSSSADAASLWLEARTAMLLARLRSGAASTGTRDALAIATLGGAACLGRTGELGVLRAGAVGDLVCWRVDGLCFAGALSDPVEALLRCGPVAAHHTVVAGRTVVEDGRLVHPAMADVLERHRVASTRVQGRDGGRRADAPA